MSVALKVRAGDNRLCDEEQLCRRILSLAETQKISSAE